ncbi:cupin domain-containing protein [Rhizobium sp. GCM10022189]|jgi:quercetin dioxygenase-like cupin family protein|uniref:cupin domain-containing protein n=1 Tax=Rhizobium sp. GCM10022189 TaxID=3252654 RepID=UPI00361F2357
MSAIQTDTYHLFGILVRFIARNPDTGGAFSLVEATTAPGAGAPPNRHPADDESFYVLEGRYEFMIEGEKRVATPGTFVKVPPGAVHAFTNIDDKPSRMLIINMPGKVHDAFFSQAGDPMPPGTRELPPQTGEPPDIQRLVDVGRRNGVELFVAESVGR